MSKVWGDAQNERSELKQGEVTHAREVTGVLQPKIVWRDPCGNFHAPQII